METNLEEVEEKVPKSELVYDTEVRSCRCTELEKRCKKAEARCVELELEAQCRKSEYEALKSKCSTLEVANLSLEGEIKVLKSENNQFRDMIFHGANENVASFGGKRVAEGVVDLTKETDEEDKVFQLMAENRVLEFEKSKAENETEVWKQKFRELESLTLQLQKGLVLKSAEKPFDEKSYEANCYKADCGNKPSEAIESNDRSQVETTLKSLPTTDKGVGFMDYGCIPISPGKCTGNLQPAGTPFSDTPYKQFTSDEGNSRRERSNKRKRHLAFQDDRSPIKQMAPSTPSGAKPASVSIIDIHDSDEEPDLAPSTIKAKIGKGNISTNYEPEGTVGSESETNIFCDQNQDEKVGGCVDNVSFLSFPKRKRALNMVTSDTESDDDDDNVPIGKLGGMRWKQVVPDQTNIKSKSCAVAATPPGTYNVSTVTPRKRRLVSLRQSEGKASVKSCSSKRTGRNECCKSIPAAKDVDNDDSEEIGSDSEGDSLCGFIVDDLNITDGDNDSSEKTGACNSNNDCSGSDDVSSGNNACSVSQDVSDDEVNMDMILSQLKRNKDQKSDWKFEGELLAAFGKDPELCMKAVCALYRQQTSGEKHFKAAFLHNQRGFSKFDAKRGCSVAEFLTDGDPQGDLNKTVKELQEYDPKAVELCRDLATHYSKQLFEIYNSKEDPYFRSS